MKILNIILVLLIVTSYLFSQSPAQESNRKESINNLNWLSGYWTNEINGTKMEEIWLPVSNSTMIGMHRDSFKSGKIFFEYLRIEQSNDTITYLASPKGREPTPFYLKSFGINRVTFENIEHDFPQRIIYSLIEDTMQVRIEGDVSGELKYKEWKWCKTKLSEQ